MFNKEDKTVLVVLICSALIITAALIYISTHYRYKEDYAINGNILVLSGLPIPTDPSYIEQVIKETTGKDAKIAGNIKIKGLPGGIDPSGTSPGDWNKIANYIVSNYKDYDSFLVILPPDGMSYTSSALSFLIEGLDKPVGLTTFDPPSEDNPGWGNDLLTALELLSQHKIPEVMIISGEKVLRGNRSTRVNSSVKDAFASPSYPVIAEKKGELVIYPQNVSPSPDMPFKFMPIDEKKKVLYAKIYPGITCKEFTRLVQNGVDGMVIEFSGQGTVQLPEGFQKLLRELSGKGVVLVGVSDAMVKNDYKGDVIQECGGVSGGEMTTECAIAKLRFLLSHVPDKEIVRQLVGKSLRGEMR